MITRLIGAAASVALVIAALSSCESIYEDLDPCPHGVKLRFVYDYNMEYANAFPAKVDCLTLLIYDDKGNYVGRRTVTDEVLRDENYRMTLELDKGTYHFAAYGGMACDRSSFSLVPGPAQGSRFDDLRAVLDSDCLTVAGRKNLHGMYWGDLTLATADMFNEGTVKMMKNTNNIRLVLQQIDGEEVDDKDFDFSITDDNTLFGPDNDLIAAGDVTYTPWSQGQASAGVTDDDREVIVAYAELSTSRLMTKNAPRLVIRNKRENRNVVDIPLINYLLLLKSDLYADMPSQEFLDRQSEWSMVFFLDRNHRWLRTYIKINDWTVRINDTDL